MAGSRSLFAGCVTVVVLACFATTVEIDGAGTVKDYASQEAAASQSMSGSSRLPWNGDACTHDHRRCLPSFLIIGAGKAGTSSLYYYLQDHPQVEAAAQKQKPKSSKKAAHKKVKSKPF